MMASEAPSASGLVPYDLGPVDRIPPGEGQTFRVAGREIAVFRTRDDDVLATQGRCPHKAGLLADGLVGGGTVICPLHSYKFDLATGAAAGNACASLDTYRVELTSERRVVVWIRSAEQRDWSAT
jgi:nitrite reductase (NADH) small subunit